MTTEKPAQPRTVRLKTLILDNPFDGDVMIPERMQWTASALKLFRKCKRKFYWKYLYRLRTRRKSKDLLIGSAFHECLAQWYKGGRSSMHEVVDQYARRLERQAVESRQFFDQEEFDNFEILVQTFRGMMIGYADQYDRDRRSWDIDRKAIECQFRVNMGDFDFVGKIDLGTRYRNKPKGYHLVEHKTASRLRQSYLERLPLDTQIRGYVFGGINDTRLKLPITHVIYDVIAKCKLRRKSNETVSAFTERVAEAYMNDKTRYFHREDLIFDKHDLASFDHELRQTHREFQEITRQGFWRDEGWAKYQQPHDPKDPRSWNPNDGACDEYFRACEYVNLCTVGLDAGTGGMYDQNENMHEELADESAGED